MGVPCQEMFDTIEGAARERLYSHFRGSRTPVFDDSFELEGGSTRHTLLVRWYDRETYVLRASVTYGAARKLEVSFMPDEVHTVASWIGARWARYLGEPTWKVAIRFKPDNSSERADGLGGYFWTARANATYFGVSMFREYHGMRIAPGSPL